MKEKKKLIRNLFILILLVTICRIYFPYSFTPLSAHKRSERTANYGPSTIIKSQKIKDGMLYLCKYDRWYSLNTVISRIPGLWAAGNQVDGTDNDLKNPISYVFGTTPTSLDYRVGVFYGIVNNPDIKSVKVDMKLNGTIKTFEQKELYDNMFLFTWDEDVTHYAAIKITGLDKDSNTIFEKPLP